MKVYSFFGASGTHKSFNNAVAQLLNQEVTNINGNLHLRVLKLLLIILLPKRDYILLLDTDTIITPWALRLNRWNRIYVIIHRKHDCFQFVNNARVTLITLVATSNYNYLHLPHPIPNIFVSELNKMSKNNNKINIFIHKNHFNQYLFGQLDLIKNNFNCFSNSTLLMSNKDVIFVDTSLYEDYISYLSKCDVLLIFDKVYSEHRASGVICDAISLGLNIWMVQGWNQGFSNDYKSLITSGWINTHADSFCRDESILNNYINEINTKWIRFFGDLIDEK